MHSNLPQAQPIRLLWRDLPGCWLCGGVVTAHPWPGGRGGTCQGAQPATGGAGIRTYAWHVRASVDAWPGSRWRLLWQCLGCTALCSWDQGPLSALEKDCDAGKNVFMFFAVIGVCTRAGNGAPGPTPPPPGFTSQPARQALPAQPVCSGAP